MFSREHVRVFSETFTPVSAQANAYIGISLYVYRPQGYTDIGVSLRDIRKFLSWKCLLTINYFMYICILSHKIRRHEGTNY